VSVGDDADPASVPWSVLDRVISTAAGTAAEVTAVLEAILEVVCDLRRVVGGGCTACGLCATVSDPALIVESGAKEGVVGDKAVRVESGPGEGDAVSLVILFLEATSGVLPDRLKRGRDDLFGLDSEEFRAVRRLLRRRNLLGRVEVEVEGDEEVAGDVESMGAGVVWKCCCQLIAARLEMASTKEADLL
jgi:hypothetical protein